MSQELRSKFQIGAIVATCDRPELLSKRSIPSIMGQSQPPDFLIIVDDSSLEENVKLNEHYISSLIPALFLTMLSSFQGLSIDVGNIK